MVREFTLEDLDIIKFGLDTVYSESQEYQKHGYDWESAKFAITHLYHQPDYLFLVDGKSFFLGQIARQWYSEDIIGYEMLLFVHPEERGEGKAKQLVDEFTEWCKEHRVSYIVSGDTLDINPEITDKVYKSLGFEVYGTTYKRML